MSARLKLIAWAYTIGEDGGNAVFTAQTPSASPKLAEGVTFSVKLGLDSASSYRINWPEMKVRRIMGEQGLSAVDKVQSVEPKKPEVQCPVCGNMVEALTEIQPGKQACYEC